VLLLEGLSGWIRRRPARALGGGHGERVLWCCGWEQLTVAAEAKVDLFDRLPVRLLGTVLNDVPAYSPYAQYSCYMDGYGYGAQDRRETQLDPVSTCSYGNRCQETPMLPRRVEGAPDGSQMLPAIRMCRRCGKRSREGSR
jgi:hypothetical protein